MLIRSATADDATACAAIYAPYVTGSASTFETEPPTASELADRIVSAIAWFVCEDDGAVIGYAYASRFHPRAAYRWACEVSVYLEPASRGKGVGRALYDVLLPHLAERGYRAAIGGITLPNPASERLHEALGFEPVGTYRRIGYKLGAWHDVHWTQKTLATGEGEPPEPV
jgi:phosphinothricin acetyltransferase